MSDSWLDAEKYLGNYCYPKFIGEPYVTHWKRKIKAYRVRHVFSTGSIPQVKVWRTLGWEWVPVYDIQLISNYRDA